VVGGGVGPTTTLVLAGGGAVGGGTGCEALFITTMGCTGLTGGRGFETRTGDWIGLPGKEGLVTTMGVCVEAEVCGREGAVGADIEFVAADEATDLCFVL